LLELKYSLENTLRYWPNPTSGDLHLQIPEGLKPADIRQIEIRDQLGRMTEELSIQAWAENSLVLDLTALSPGIYFLQLISTGHWYTAKVIKE